MENPKEEKSQSIGHYVYSHTSGESKVVLDVWLEEDGFFRIKFHQETGKDSSSLNEEKGMICIEVIFTLGTYVRSSNNLTLQSFERQWRWKVKIIESLLI